MEKTIYNLDLHEALKLQTNLGTVEVTRVPGGWVYCFDYPGFRQSQIVFIPANEEFGFVEIQKKVIAKGAGGIGAKKPKKK